MLRTRRALIVGPPPALPPGSPSATLAAHLTGVLDAAFPDWQDTASRHLAHAEGDYRKDDCRNFATSLKAHPYALLLLVIESGAAAQHAAGTPIGEALKSLAQRTPGPAHLLCRFPATQADTAWPAVFAWDEYGPTPQRMVFGGPSHSQRPMSAARQLEWNSQRIVWEVLTQDLISAGGGPLAPARKDVVETIPRCAELLSAQTALRHLQRSPLDETTRERVGEQLQRLHTAIEGETDDLRSRMADYGHLKATHAEALMAVDREHEEALHADIANETVARVAALTETAAPRQPRQAALRRGAQPTSPGY